MKAECNWNQEDRLPYTITATAEMKAECNLSKEPPVTD